MVPFLVYQKKRAGQALLSRKRINSLLTP